MATVEVVVEVEEAGGWVGIEVGVGSGFDWQAAEVHTITLKTSANNNLLVTIQWPNRSGLRKIGLFQFCRSH